MQVQFSAGLLCTAAIREIRVYEGNRVEIDYLFPESYRALLEGR